MITELEEYIGEGYTIPVPLKVNNELLRYVQQAVLDLKYRNAQMYLRDLINGHAKGSICQESLRDLVGIPKESLTYQGIPVNQVNQTERSGIPTEISVKQIDLPQLTSNSENELPQHTGKSVIELDKSAVDMSQVKIIEDYVPEGISATQYRMYVRRLEDENVKLTDALKVCHKALEGSQKQGDLSAMLYQSELGIHQIIS